MVQERTLRFSLQVKPGDPLTFHRFSFPVEEEDESVTLRFTPGKGTNGIDLAVESPRGFHGWSGGTKGEVFLSRDRATEGYLPGLPPGEWRAVVGTAKLFHPAEVLLTVTVRKRTSRWLKGDLHMHTRHSDGNFTVPELIGHLRDAGLEYAALTDHNTVSGCSELTPNAPLLLIPGVELTSYGGHANLWNISDPIPNILCSTRQEVEAALCTPGDEVIRSLNHPFHKDPWRWGFEGIPCTHVEIWNALWGEGNQTSLAWWHNRLCAGEKLIGVGGSDAHGQVPEKWFGRPTTWIWTDEYSRRGLLRGLRGGAVTVSRNPEAPALILEVEGIPMGGRASHSAEAPPSGEVVVTVKTLQSAPGELRIITEEGLKFKMILDGRAGETVEISVPRPRKFLRGELWELPETRAPGEENPLSLGNPIYFC